VISNVPAIDATEHAGGRTGGAHVDDVVTFAALAHAQTW